MTHANRPQSDAFRPSADAPVSRIHRDLPCALAFLAVLGCGIQGIAHGLTGLGSGIAAGLSAFLGAA